MSTVVISVDAGLGWGYHDQETPAEAALDAGRPGWRTLLDLLDEHELPATWGIVGHLFQSECSCVHEQHPLGPNWFRSERETLADRSELRYAPDLVEATLSADVEHDVGFETYSHVELGHEDVSDDLARAETAAFFEAAPESLPTPHSVLFPRNEVGHRDVLAEWGFDVYRGESPVDTDSSSFGPRTRALARATVSTPPIVTPRVDDYGLVNVPASLHLFGDDDRSAGLCERAFGDPVARCACRAVDRLVDRDDGVFHVWLRPSEIQTERDEQRLRTLLEYVADRRGEVDVATLADVAREHRPLDAVDQPDQVAQADQ